MAFDPGLAVEQLIAVYRRAYLDILETIARKTAKGNVTGFERAMLEDVNRILLELDNNAVNWANQVIPRVYNTFAELVLETWIKAGLRPPRMRAGFAQVHRMAVQVLADNFLANMRDAHNFIGRRVRDEWRKVSLEVVTEKVAAGQTERRLRLVKRCEKPKTDCSTLSLKWVLAPSGMPGAGSGGWTRMPRWSLEQPPRKRPTWAR